MNNKLKNIILEYFSLSMEDYSQTYASSFQTEKKWIKQTESGSIVGAILKSNKTLCIPYYIWMPISFLFGVSNKIIKEIILLWAKNNNINAKYVSLFPLIYRKNIYLSLI